MIISPHQCHHHHSCHPSPHHSFIPILKLFFFPNPSSIDIWHLLGVTPRLFEPTHGFCFYSFHFFLSFSFHYYSLFLTFSVFLFFSFLYFSHFSNFVSFAFNIISILSISHFIFLLNISVRFSLCVRLNWQFVCQFLSANSPLYCIVLYCNVEQLQTSSKHRASSSNQLHRKLGISYVRCVAYVVCAALDGNSS